MYKTVFKLPRLGGNESEAKILAWKKQPGERFAPDDVLLEVETDKAVVEVPAQAAGVMGQLLKQPDDYAAFDEVLAEFELDQAPADAEPAAAAAAAAGAPAAATPAAAASRENVAASPAPLAAATRPAGSRPVASPAARRQARSAGLDLAGRSGSGPGGRIVLRDLPDGSPAVSASADEWVALADGQVRLRRWNAPAATQQPTCVLIHGLFGDLDTWAGLASQLADAGLPVLAFDLPLHGGTTVTAASLDEMASLAGRLLDAVVPGRRLLVGHSLGGALALKLAQASRPGGLHGLALIAPAGVGTEIDQGFIDGMLHAGQPTLLRRELAKLTHRPQPFGDAWVADLHASLRQRAAVLQAFAAGFAAHGTQQMDLLPVLQALVVPVSVMWGRNDRVLPWKQALTLPPQVALHLFADTGHMPQTEQTRLVTRILERAAG